MEIKKKMNIIEKLEIIFQTITILLERAKMIDNEIGSLSVTEIKKIVEEQKIFENIDKESILSFNTKYIKIEEFEDTTKFYDSLYKFFLKQMNKFCEEKKDSTKLFKTFNQAYYYRKYIVYMFEFVKKYPETLSNDIIKEKLFEIVHSLESDDKLYREDFYFYISMCHIRYLFKNNDISIPEYKKFNAVDFENSNTESILSKIKEEKLSIIKIFIQIIGNKKSKNNLKEILLGVKKEIKENTVFNGEKLDSICWDEIIKEKEKNFIKYLEENKFDDDVINLNAQLELDINLKKKYKFYYIDRMDKFISLPQEDKYVIVNSCNIDIKFYDLFFNYISLKNSYDEGMKDGNYLKETIKEIIEDKKFFEEIRDKLTSEKVLDYIKNPLQYIKDSIMVYDEKEEERKKYKKILKERKISRFNNEKSQEELENQGNLGDEYFETHGLPDLFSEISFLDEKLKNIDDENFKCQLELDYDCI